MAARSVQRERKSRVMTLYSPRTSAAISMSTAHIFEFQQWIFHLLCNNLQSKVVFNTQFSFSNWGLKYIAAKFTHFNVYLSFPRALEGIRDTHPSARTRLSPQTGWMEKEESRGRGHQDTYYYSKRVKGFNNEVRGHKIDTPRCADRPHTLCNCSQRCVCFEVQKY